MLLSLYDEICQKLESRGVMPDRPPGLESTSEALKRIGFHFSPNRVVIVAGTNGKGTVCATLEALLLSVGQRVGLYTSPHLVDTTERFRIQGRDISRELFCKAYEYISSQTEDLKLSHFEFLTIMAAWIFCSGQATPPVDWLILEVGLGGTWDATNAIPHKFCVITKLGLDHENLLGSSLEEIARNKFGIIPKHGPSVVVHGPQIRENHELRMLSQECQKATQSLWIEVPPFDLQVRETEYAEPEFFIHTQWGTAQMVLPGLRAAENSNLALAAFEQMGFSPEWNLKALSHVRWSARMEKVLDSPRIYLSGDHNPQGIQSLLELLRYYRYDEIFILVGIGIDKNLSGILEPLFALKNAHVFLTETPFRGRKLADYGSYLNRAERVVLDPWDAFCRIVTMAKPKSMVLVTGSLYLAGAIGAHLKSANHLKDLDN